MGIANQENKASQKPRQVTYAFYLILGSTSIRFLGYIVNTILFWEERFNSQPVYYRICLGLPFLIDLWLAFKINTGRNWARWVFAIFTALSLIDIFNLLRSFSDYPLQSTLYVISFALSLFAIFLLFQSPISAWFKTTGISKSISKVPLEAEEEYPSPEVSELTPKVPPESVKRADKPPKKAGFIGFITDKEEAPSVAAFVQDWQHLNMPRRLIWALRIVLFLGIIFSLFLPWYQTDMGYPGSGWIPGLDLAGWSCGAFFLPYIAILLFGAWAILRPGGRRVWAYRVTLILWLAYNVMLGTSLSSNYKGPIVSFTVTAIALAVEAVDFAIVQIAKRKEVI